MDEVVILAHGPNPDLRFATAEAAIEWASRYGGSAIARGALPSDLACVVVTSSDGVLATLAAPRSALRRTVGPGAVRDRLDKRTEAADELLVIVLGAGRLLDERAVPCSLHHVGLA